MSTGLRKASERRGSSRAEGGGRVAAGVRGPSPGSMAQMTRHERRSVCGGAVGAKVASKTRLSGRSKNERGREWAGERVGD